MRLLTFIWPICLTRHSDSDLRQLRPGYSKWPSKTVSAVCFFGVAASLSVFTLSDAAEPKAKSAENQYQIIVSKDDKVCRYVLNALNRHVVEKKSRHQQIEDVAFETINWKQYGVRHNGSFNYAARYAKFDLDNDGHDEVVVLEAHSSYHSIGVNALFIFPDNTSPENFPRYQDLQERSVGSVEIRPEGYELRLLPALTRESWMKADKQYFPSLTSVVLNPFLFDGRYYLLLSESADVRIDPELLVVAQYRQGRVHYSDPTKMTDICYVGRREPSPTIKRY